MIITQKFNSAKDIDPEFIPDLEKLLSDRLPTFELIKQFEEKAELGTHFAYYLFFGNQTNAPIGFAQLQIETKEKKSRTGILAKFFNRSKSLSRIKWLMPGSLKEGIVFDPKYIQHACPKAKDIFMEYFERKDVEEQSLLYSSAYQAIAEFESRADQSPRIVPETLIKNQDSYQGYFENLAPKRQAEIKNAWKKVHVSKLEMDSYEHFKACFAYKTKGAEQYKTLKNNEKIASYIQLDSEINFLTIASKDAVEALVFFFEGRNGNGFYDIAFSELEEAVPHQLAIMQFFEREHLSRLHYLGDMTNPSQLLELGFTQREQFCLSLKKVIQ